MQIISNSIPKAISLWSAWQMLFDREVGDVAYIFTGYLSGGPPGPGWASDIIGDVVDWLTCNRPGKPARTLKIYVGRWPDPESAARSVDMLARLLASVPVTHRQNVFVHEFANLHIKAYGIFLDNPEDSSCIRLLTGSSNLTYSSMAMGNNIEMDAYFSEADGDGSRLDLYAGAMQDAAAQCMLTMVNQAPPVVPGNVLVAGAVYSDSPNQTKLYSELEAAVDDYEIEFAISTKRASNKEMQDASDDCLRNDN